MQLRYKIRYWLIDLLVQDMPVMLNIVITDQNDQKLLPSDPYKGVMIMNNYINGSNLHIGAVRDSEYKSLRQEDKT